MVCEGEGTAAEKLRSIDFAEHVAPAALAFFSRMDEHFMKFMF